MKIAGDDDLVTDGYRLRHSTGFSFFKDIYEQRLYRICDQIIITGYLHAKRKGKNERNISHINERGGK